MKLSKFGNKFTQESGILTLMDDLGEALTAGERMLMLGGGNPARILRRRQAESPAPSIHTSPHRTQEATHA